MSTAANKLKLMNLRIPFVLLSLLVIAGSIYTWFSTPNSLKYGIDFLGGVDVVVRFDKPTNIADLRKAVSDGGFDNAIVQEFEKGTNEFSIRIKASQDSDEPKKVVDAIAKMENATFTVSKQDFVGPIIGDEIKEDGLGALTFAIVGILIYISVRFEFRFALGAIVALVHDVIVATGVFVFSGREMSAAVLAALLTIVGYSLNDTIVVFDRVRENMNMLVKKGGSAKKKSKPEDFIALVDNSIVQTLSRTLLTSLTTLFVVATLFVYGGAALEDLSFTLVVGVIVGTYSSIFIACPTVIFLEKNRKEKD